MNKSYWIRQLWVSAFIKDAERKELAKKEVDYHWPGSVPKDCECRKVR